MIYKNALFLLVIILAFPLFGADYYIDDIYNAEEIGRGNVEGFSTSSQGIWSNPASLKNVKNISVGLYSAKFMDSDVNYNNYTASFKLKSFKIGVGYYDVRSSDIEKNSLDDSGEAITDSSYSLSSSITKIAIQKPMKEWGSVGAALSRYKYSGYNLTGKGYGLDLGGILSIPIKKRIETISISTTFKNIIPQKVDYSNGSSEKIPSSLVLSGSVHFLQEFEAYIQRSIHFKKAQLSGVGLSYRPRFIPGRAMSFSLGRNTYFNQNDASEIHSVFSTGVGLHLLGFEFHFAYQNDPNSYSEKQFYYTSVINF